MDITLEPGTYVVAVSGGVDSMAMLHILQSKNRSLAIRPWKLIVAHFDHGMREDSTVDRKLVQATAAIYGLPFVYSRLALGAGASEDTARRARYQFLHQVRESSGADAIVTAHHEGDLLETAVLNLIRGTGRSGLTSLKSTDVIKRPLLHATKPELIRYATAHGLKWREDSTNIDPRYLRNHLRHNVLPKASDTDKQKLLALIRDMHKLNISIDEEVKAIYQIVQEPGAHINRAKFIMLPHGVALELMLHWLRAHHAKDVSRPLLEKLVAGAKTLAPGKQLNVDKHLNLRIGKATLSLKRF